MGLSKVVREFSNRSKAMREYHRDKRLYNNLLADDIFMIDDKDCIPVISDKYMEAGSIDIHYFLQDIYMARKVIQFGEKDHYDIGSRVDGFISHLLVSDSIKSVTMLDIRPLSVSIPKLNFIQTDATTLDGIPDNSIRSLSSLHAIEHFGLGRYGDPIDPDAWKKALIAVQKKLARGGRFFLSVPIGVKDKVCFNAHRIFSPETIMNSLDHLELSHFCYVNQYKVIESTCRDYLKTGGEYDCGMFIFDRK